MRRQIRDLKIEPDIIHSLGQTITRSLVRAVSLCVLQLLLLVGRESLLDF